MLKLKRIRIQGFKSFADKTELTFDGAGVAAIVGPNGCGKSNISDAIAWVLGEQRAKFLRSGRMQDVIFNGTRSRPPLGLAEVTVTLLDPESSIKVAPSRPPSSAISPTTESKESNGMSSQDQLGSQNIEQSKFISSPTAVSQSRNPTKFSSKPNELVVSRRLFRSGDSEYLLNGRKVRLRDVQDIFLGTGLGPDSYALIEQDRVGLILSSKPSDRRALIEEAAGVTKFKAKRKLADSKLEQSKNNLFRVNDIVEEVSRQLNSLKRQAAKARRYQKLCDRLSELSRSLFYARAAQLSELLDVASKQFEKVRAAVDHKQNFIEDHELKFRRGNDIIFQAETTLKQHREQLSELHLERERGQQQIQYKREQLTHLETRSQENLDELQQLSIEEQKRSDEVLQKQQFFQEVVQNLESLEQEHTAQNLKNQSQQTLLVQLEASCDQLRSEQLVLLSQTANLRNKMTQLDELEKQLAKQTIRLEKDREQATQNQESLEASYTLASNQRQQQEAQLVQQKSHIQVLSSELNQHKKEWVQIQQQLTEKREETSAHGHRLKSLKELATHHAYSTEAVRLLLSMPAKSQESTFQTKGILADLLEVETAYERPIEEFLKHELEYLLVESHDMALKGIDLLRKSGTGRSTFLVLSKSPPEEDQDELKILISELIRKDPRLIPVSHIIRLPTHYLNSLRAILPHLFHSLIAPNYAVALNIAQLYPKVTVLTPEGEVIRNQFISGGGRTATGHLSLKREIRELDRDSEPLHRDLVLLEDKIEVLRETLETKEVELTQEKQQVQELDKALIGSHHQLSHLGSELENSKQDDDITRLEMQKNLEEKDQLQHHRIRSETEISKAESRKTEINQTLDIKQNNLRHLREASVQNSQLLSEVRSELSACRERKIATESDLTRLQANLKVCRERTVKLQIQRDDWLQQGLEIESSIKQLEERLFTQEVRRASLESEIRTEDNQLEKSRQSQVALGEQLHRWRHELDELQNERTQTEVNQARLTSDFSHLEETCQKELGLSLELVRSETALQTTVADSQKLEEEHHELKHRLESLGPVNMMALEEFQESEQRFDFLTQQRQDLLDSIEDTTAAIQEIDQVSQEQFRKAFEAVNLNFKESFRDLLGGGHGEMKLLDQQDLDAGIEIIAQPPGKRLQNVLLLSGGEKALTAIALLLAIFKYQPSPFCVLDEVDAPLDDVNLGRYSRIIKSMSDETQFLLITHSKRTMEVADTLYGVTMQEAGVSKLVSVQFN